jgi:hypothetical protein
LRVLKSLREFSRVWISRKITERREDRRNQISQRKEKKRKGKERKKRKKNSFIYY